MSEVLHRPQGRAPAALPRLEPSEYLGSVLPVLLSASKVAPPKPVTVVQIVVSDADGLDYFYTVTEQGVTTTRGLSDQVDLTLSILTADLGDLSQNKLDVKRAVKTARLRVMGDEGVLGWLSKRLAA